MNGILTGRKIIPPQSSLCQSTEVKASGVYEDTTGCPHLRLEHKAHGAGWSYGGETGDGLRAEGLDECGLCSSGNTILSRFLSKEANGEECFFENSINLRIQKMSDMEDKVGIASRTSSWTGSCSHSDRRRRGA